MRNKIVVILSFLIVVMACKKTQNESTENQTVQDNSQILTEKEISNLKYTDYILDAKAEEAVKDWAEYMQVNDVVLKMKKGDLSFFINNDVAIEMLILDQKLNIPKALNSESIISRVVILETRLLKLKSLANLSTTNKMELLESTKAFLVAFSNLNFQMNKKVEFDSQSIERP